MYKKERSYKMASNKSYDERIAELKKKQEQLKAQEKELERRQSAEKRKKRTKRLIELGGIIESVLGRETNDDDKIKLMNFLKKQETNGRYFTRAMNADLITGNTDDDQ